MIVQFPDEIDRDPTTRNKALRHKCIVQKQIQMALSVQVEVGGIQLVGREIYPGVHSVKGKRILRMAPAVLVILVASLCWGTTNPAMTFRGQGTAVNATVLGINTVLGDTGPLPSKGGALENDLVTVNIPLLLNGVIVHADAIGIGDHTEASATVTFTTLKGECSTDRRFAVDAQCFSTSVLNTFISRYVNEDCGSREQRRELRGQNRVGTNVQFFGFPSIFCAVESRKLFQHKNCFQTLRCFDMIEM